MTSKNILIINAHPLQTSLCHRLSQMVLDEFEKHGQEPTVRALYQDHFNAELTQAERNSYYEHEFDHSELIEEINDLVEAEILILVFPTWWFGFPAILKGWFDRVWAPGVAFDHATDLSAIQPKLEKLKHVVAITTMGSPWWVDWFLLRRPVHRVLKTALIGVSAPKAKLKFLTQYKAEKLNEPQILKFEARIKSAINNFID